MLSVFLEKIGVTPSVAASADTNPSDANGDPVISFTVRCSSVAIGGRTTQWSCQYRSYCTRSCGGPRDFGGLKIHGQKKFFHHFGDVLVEKHSAICSAYILSHFNVNLPSTSLEHGIPSVWTVCVVLSSDSQLASINSLG